MYARPRPKHWRSFFARDDIIRPVLSSGCFDIDFVYTVQAAGTTYRELAFNHMGANQMQAVLSLSGGSNVRCTWGVMSGFGYLSLLSLKTQW